LQIKTYRPETGRYGAGRMHLAERCFNIDSDFVMELVGKSAAVNDLYFFSIRMIESIWAGADFTLGQQLLFAEDMANRFATEMNIATDGFKKLNLGFKEFESDHSSLTLNKLQHKKMIRTEQSFLEVLQTCNPSEQNRLLADLFHMHTNRLFNNDQRMHELIIYYYLTKRLKTKIGRLKKESANII